MSEKWHVDGADIIGARACQEDDWRALELPQTSEQNAQLLALVADGLGGYAAGEVASELVVKTIAAEFKKPGGSAKQRLAETLELANNRLGEEIERYPDYEGMGTTLVAAVCFDDRIEWLSVGDSFFLRYRDGRIETINPLHTYGATLDAQVKRGEIDAQEAISHPDRNLLTSAVMGEEITEVSSGELEVQAGDVFILATDGILSLEWSILGKHCKKHGAVNTTRLVQSILESLDKAAHPNQDNATVVVFRFGEELEDDEEDSDEPKTRLAKESKRGRFRFPWRKK